MTATMKHGSCRICDENHYLKDLGSGSQKFREERYLILVPTATAIISCPRAVHEGANSPLDTVRYCH